MGAVSCPICDNDAAKENILVADSKLGSDCECPRCGHFLMVGEAVRLWNESAPTSRQIANASGWIREHQGIWIARDDVANLLKLVTPSVAERADRLLIEIANRFPVIGQPARFSYQEPSLLAITWSSEFEEVVYLFDDYLDMAHGYLDVMKITPKGYSYLQQIQHSRIASKSVSAPCGLTKM